MKHLKPYRLFESLESIDDNIKVIKDLLSDISDDDIIVDVSNNFDSRQDSNIPVGIFILIGCHPDDLPTGNINISKYKSNLDSVNEYLEGEDFEMVGFSGETDEDEYIDEDVYSVDELVDKTSSKSMMYITIQFIKK